MAERGFVVDSGYFSFKFSRDFLAIFFFSARRRERAFSIGESVRER